MKFVPQLMKKQKVQKESDNKDNEENDKKKSLSKDLK